MLDLSPAVQAIREAVDAVFARSPAPPTTEDVAAAVLRAAAEHVIGSTHDYERVMAIAAELEGHHG